MRGVLEDCANHFVALMTSVDLDIFVKGKFAWLDVEAITNVQLTKLVLTASAEMHVKIFNVELALPVKSSTTHHNVVARLEQLEMLWSLASPHQQDVRMEFVVGVNDAKVGTVSKNVKRVIVAVVDKLVGLEAVETNVIGMTCVLKDRCAKRDCVLLAVAKIQTVPQMLHVSMENVMTLAHKLRVESTLFAE